MADGGWLLVQTFKTIADLPPAVQIAAAGAVIAILAVFVLAVQSGGSRFALAFLAFVNRWIQLERRPFHPSVFLLLLLWF